MRTLPHLKVLIRGHDPNDGWSIDLCVLCDRSLIFWISDGRRILITGQDHLYWCTGLLLGLRLVTSLYVKLKLRRGDEMYCPFQKASHVCNKAVLSVVSTAERYLMRCFHLFLLCTKREQNFIIQLISYRSYEYGTLATWYKEKTFKPSRLCTNFVDYMFWKRGRYWAKGSITRFQLWDHKSLVNGSL